MDILAPFITVLATREVVLDCMATGVPTPTVTWSHNGVSIDTDNRLSIDTNGALRIMNAQMDDRGDYTCHANNGYHQIEGNITLDVYSE